MFKIIAEIQEPKTVDPFYTGPSDVEANVSTDYAHCKGSERHQVDQLWNRPCALP